MPYVIHSLSWWGINDAFHFVQHDDKDDVLVWNPDWSTYIRDSLYREELHKNDQLIWGALRVDNYFRIWTDCSHYDLLEPTEKWNNDLNQTELFIFRFWCLLRKRCGGERRFCLSDIPSNDRKEINIYSRPTYDLSFSNRQSWLFFVWWHDCHHH